MARDMDSYQNVKPNQSHLKKCATDLIGPWTVQVCGKPYEFKALTALDTVTNLVELIRLHVSKNCSK